MLGARVYVMCVCGGGSGEGGFRACQVSYWPFIDEMLGGKRKLKKDKKDKKDNSTKKPKTTPAPPQSTTATSSQQGGINFRYTYIKTSF